MEALSADHNRRAFGGYIGPRGLLSLVHNTVPYHLSADPPAESAPARLSELAVGHKGWRALLRYGHTLGANPQPSPGELTDYFALCLAAHFSTVMSYVPTDVDTKIRNHLWFDQTDAAELARMARLALTITTWDARAVSARVVDCGADGLVSGHDGERLAVQAAGMLALQTHPNASELAPLAAELEEAIDLELQREARAFTRLADTPGEETKVLLLAAVLVHNVGDLDQGLSARGGRRQGRIQKIRLGRLAHERFGRFDGAFGRAAVLYQEVMASEGHRNYPLRELKILRRDPSLLLPFAPYLDSWGARLATYPGWGIEEHAQVVSTLVTACHRVPGQQGYYRALAGFNRTYSGGLANNDLAWYLGVAVKKSLRDAHLRRLIAVPQRSFESSLGKRARALLGSASIH